MAFTREAYLKEPQPGLARDLVSFISLRGIGRRLQGITHDPQNPRVEPSPLERCADYFIRGYPSRHVAKSMNLSKPKVDSLYHRFAQVAPQYVVR